MERSSCSRRSRRPAPTSPARRIAAALHKISGYEGLQGTFTVQENGETLDKTQVGMLGEWRRQTR